MWRWYEKKRTTTKENGFLLCLFDYLCTQGKEQNCVLRRAVCCWWWWVWKRRGKWICACMRKCGKRKKKEGRTGKTGEKANETMHVCVCYNSLDWNSLFSMLHCDYSSDYHTTLLRLLNGVKGTRLYIDHIWKNKRRENIVRKLSVEKLEVGLHLCRIPLLMYVYTYAQHNKKYLLEATRIKSW